MQLIEGRLIVSPSDLTGFLECEHLIQQELAVTRGELVRPARDDPELEVVTRRGLEHETRHLAHLRAQHGRVAEFPFPNGSLAALRAAHEQTVHAMREGAEVIYQATFFDGRWRCHADFLLRVERPSLLGDFSYEVADAKLAHKAKPSAILQCCAYSEQLARLQGIDPENFRLILGDRTEEALRYKDFAAYYRSIRRRFEATVLGAPVITYPDPVDHCDICRWKEVCEQRRRDDDHLSIVARMRRDQARRLTEAGIATMAALAESPSPLAIEGVGEAALDRLQRQAGLQVRQRETGEIHYEVLPPAGERLGFQNLPPPSAGDLFFDMEGDPFAGEDGLEYLFGILEMTADGPRHHTFWAHDTAAEKQAFEQTVDFLIDRLNRFPDMHVYHYAAYEPNALKWLMGNYATREAEVDRLLRGRTLVDLYQVVRQSVLVSTESYSLKQLEGLFRDKRSTEITDAAQSIVAYEEWLQRHEPALLDEIGRYNRDDCLSTAQLRDWLEARRLEAIRRFGEIPRPRPEADAVSSAQLEAERETADLATHLLAGVPEDEVDRLPDQQARYLLAHSLAWHRREGKSQWWDYFRRSTLTDEQLTEDRESIGGLRYVGVVSSDANARVHRYAFDPNQEYKIGEGDEPHDPRARKRTGLVVKLDGINGLIDIKRSARWEEPHPTSLIPTSPIPDTEQRRAVQRLGDWVAEHGIDAPGEHRAARDLLRLQPPRVQDHPRGSPLVAAGERAGEAVRRAALALDHSYLAIQGPPGSGKTYTGAEIVLDLVEHGRRVGITANSHRVISNLLDKICAHAYRRRIGIRALQKADESERCSDQVVRCVNSNQAVDEALAADEVDIVAGTPWVFAREAIAGRLDTLVVDEAGQMSLANALAISQAAQNLVLLGDPQQLRQPSHGVHPPGVDVSALEHVIDDHAVMPPERGAFLETTYRLHPRVCAFISEVFYEDKLLPDPSCSLQSLQLSDGAGGLGLRFLPVAHAGDRTASPAEVAAVAGVVQSLVGLSWTDRDGATRPLRLGDILIVAPYNAQVHKLIEGLPAGARVGTVDKFQGQEAPVVIYSMATSSVDDAPRGMSFLFSLNRMNVATSRAQGLVVLVCSPELLKGRCRSPHQMRQANALCRLVEIATGA